MSISNFCFGLNVVLNSVAQIRKAKSHAFLVIVAQVRKAQGRTARVNKAAKRLAAWQQQVAIAARRTRGTKVAHKAVRVNHTTWIASKVARRTDKRAAVVAAIAARKPVLRVRVEVAAPVLKQERTTRNLAALQTSCEIVGGCYLKAVARRSTRPQPKKTWEDFRAQAEMVVFKSVEDLMNAVASATGHPTTSYAQGATMSLSLTDSQKAVYDKAVDFIDGNAGQFLRLEGYAGTGKSFTTAEIIKYATNKGIAVAACSPTNKASFNLNNMLVNAGCKVEATTLAKLLGVKQDRSNGTGSFKRDEKKSTMHFYNLVIVDEFSMVSKEYAEVLLTVAKDCGAKILFVGDPAQLPPVNEKITSVIALVPNVVSLTEVLRYSGEVARAAEEIRNNLLYTNQTYLFDTSEDGTIVRFNKQEFDANLPAAFANFKYLPNDNRILVWRNDTAAAYNQMVREYIFGAAIEQINVDDCIILNEPIKGFFNSEELIVIRNYGITTDKYDIRSYQLEVKSLFSGKASILNVCLDEDESKRMTQLMALTQTAREQGGRAWKPFYDLKEAYANYNFAYALTVHKAQGSTVANTYIIVDDFQGCRESKQNLQYTALTRTGKTAYILQEGPARQVASSVSTSAQATENKTPAVEALTSTAERPCDDVKPAPQETKTYSNHSMNNNSEILAVQNSITALDNLAWGDVRQLPKQLGFKLESCAKYNKANILEAARKFYAAQLHELYQDVTVVEPVAIVSTLVEVEIETAPEVVIEVKQLVVVSDYSTEELGVEEVISASITPVEMLAKSEQLANLKAMFGSTASRYFANYGGAKALDHATDTLATACVGFVATVRNSRSMELPPVIQKAMQNGVSLIVPEAYENKIPCVDLLRAAMVSETTEFAKITGRINWSNETDSKMFAELRKSTEETLQKAKVGDSPKYTKSDISAVCYDLTIAAYFRKKGASIVIPAYLTKYFADLGGDFTCFHPVDTNWVMPATGVTYDELLSAFELIESRIQRCGKFGETLAARPLTVVKGNKAFEVLFGADFKIRVEKKGIAFIYELDKEQSHTFKQVLFAAHCDNRRNHAREVVVMSGIDQIFYLFENYLLLDVNRKYTGNAFAECAKFHQSARQFILNHAKIDSAIGYYENAARIQFSSDTATAVVGAMVGYFTYAGGFYKKGSIVGRNVMSITATNWNKSTMDFTQYLNDIAFKASLTEANKANTRKVIAAANEHGMAILAYGGMNLLQNKYLVKDLSLLQRDKAVYVIKGIVKHHWVKWGFAEKLGGATDVNIAQALMSCKAIADAVGDIQIGSARFWDIVATVKVALSTKESKLFKRLASDFSQNMRGVNERSARLRKTGDTFVPTTTAIKAIIGKQIAIDPGIALSNGDLAHAAYTENGRDTRHYNPVATGFVVFEEKFELAARPLGTIGYDFSGVIKRSGGILAENLGVPVVKGEVIGFIHTRIQGGEVILSTALVAESTGSLMKAIIRDVKNLSGEYYTTVLLVYEKKTDVLKLRFAQKSNVVKSNFALLFDFSPAVSHCEIFVPQDAYKGDDNFNHPWTIIAETFCRTAEGSVLRNAILEANQILYPECVTSDIFHWDLTLALMGKYEFLLDLYYANFRKSVWFHDRSMQSGYTQIMSMHHNSPDWRQVAANEEFSGKENFVDNNYVMFTDAVDAITDTDVVLVTWQEIVDGKLMYHTATRGMCYMGTEETPLYLPCNIEYISIEQATSVTRTPPNVLVALGVRGYKDVAADMIEASKSKNASDKVLFALLNNVSLTSNGIKATTVDLFRSGVSSSSLLTEEQLGNLKAIQDNRSEWFELLSLYFSNYVFKLTDSSWAEVSIHLPTFFKLGGKGLSNAGESITSKVCDYFWLWMAGESCSADCLQAVAKDIRVMLGNFLDGETQVKGQTRAGDALYQAAAALSCIPSDELWVLESHKDLYVKVLGKGIENGYVGTTRMPMTRLACLKMRFISDADNQYLWDTYGYEIQPWRAYFGTGMMYLNWGDLDGDKSAIVNLTKYVRHYGLPVDNFESMLWTVRETLGYDMLSKEWWLSNKPAQYFGDHFQILPWKKVSAKAGLKIEKSFMTQTSYVEFQEAAFDVQTKGVGCTYKIATIHAMLAEVLPLVMSRYPDAQWANSFKYLLEDDGAHLFANRLEQIYEVCLGGYGKEAAMAVMGYLLRACNGDTDDTAWTNLPEVAKKLGFGGSFGSVVPGAATLLSFSAVPVEGKGNVDDCLEELGFNAADRQKFLTAAMVAGVCAKMGDLKEDKLALLPVELQLVFSVVQALLDVSQAKEVKAIKNGDKNPKETANFDLAASIIGTKSTLTIRYKAVIDEAKSVVTGPQIIHWEQSLMEFLGANVDADATFARNKCRAEQEQFAADGGSNNPAADVDLVLEALQYQNLIDHCGDVTDLYQELKKKTVTFQLFSNFASNRQAKQYALKTGVMEIGGALFTEVPVDEDSQDDEGGNVVAPLNPSPSDDGGGATEELATGMTPNVEPETIVTDGEGMATCMTRNVKSTVTSATPVAEVVVELATPLTRTVKSEVVATTTADAPVAVVVEELATRMTRNVKSTATIATPVAEVAVVEEVAEVIEELATRMTRTVKTTMTPATPVAEVEVVLEVEEVELSLAELVEESLAAGYSEEETFSDLIAMGYKAKEVIVTIAQFIS